jgi:predicted aspartyl protease
MKALLVLSITLLLQQQQMPSSPAEQQDGPGPQMRRQIPLAESVVGDEAQVPLHYVDGLPAVDIVIHGRKLTFGIDTGAIGLLRLEEATSESLKLETIGEGRAVDPSGKNPQIVKITKVDRLELGGITFYGLEASTAIGRAKIRAVDGVLGLNLFNNFVLTIDYGKNVLVVKRGSLPAADGISVTHYDGPLPSVPMTIEGKTMAAHLDTGNTRAPILVPTEFAQQLAHYDQRAVDGQAHTVSSTIDMFKAPMVGEAKAGGVTLSATAVDWPSVIPVANIGSLALKHVRVEVDPKNHLIRLGISE